MRRIWIIFRKEALDTLRDRRTLMIMVGMPLLLIPLLLLAVTKIQSAQFEKAEREQQRIAFFGIEYAPELYARFEADERLLLINGRQPRQHDYQRGTGRGSTCETGFPDPDCG